MLPLLIAMAAAQQLGKAKQQDNQSRLNAATMRYSPWTHLGGQAAQAESANQANGANWGEGASNVIGTQMAQDVANDKTAAEQDFRNKWLAKMPDQSEGTSPGEMPMLAMTSPSEYKMPEMGGQFGGQRMQQNPWALASQKRGY